MECLSGDLINLLNLVSSLFYDGHSDTWCGMSKFAVFQKMEKKLHCAKLAQINTF